MFILDVPSIWVFFKVITQITKINPHEIVFTPKTMKFSPLKLNISTVSKLLKKKILYQGQNQTK